MFFLLRIAFWLGLVLVLLPIGTGQHTPSAEVSASDAISAASATVGDLRGFCGRQPDACTIGSQVATAIGYRAQAGAKMIYGAISDAMTKHDAAHDGASPHDSPAAADPAQTATTRAAAGKFQPSRAMQGTLTPADLVPSWRGPALRKDARPSA